MQTLTWPILTMLPRSSLARSNRFSPIGRSFRCWRPDHLVDPGAAPRNPSPVTPLFQHASRVDETFVRTKSPAGVTGEFLGSRDYNGFNQGCLATETAIRKSAVAYYTGEAPCPCTGLPVRSRFKTARMSQKN